MSSLIRTTDNVKNSFPFEELRLPVGETVRVELNSPRMRFKAHYAGAHLDQIMMLSLSSKSPAHKSLPAGTAVTLRFIAANKACAIRTRIVKSQIPSLPLLLLEYPKSVEAVEVRKTVRVRSKLTVSLSMPESASSQFGWPRQALCSDISIEGARIEAGDLLGDIGETLMITARMPVGKVDQMLMVSGIVRNVEDFEDPINGEYRVVHGVEFVDAGEEAQLVLSGFVYQQMLKEQGAI